MRIPIILALLSFPAFATAETIDLYTTSGWGALHQYHDIANSADASVTIYIGVSGSASVYLDGDVFNGFYNGSGVASVFTNGTGAQVILTIDETSRRVCVYQGRGQRCSTIWTLQDGTLVR